MPTVAQQEGIEVRQNYLGAVWSTRYRDHFRGVHSDAAPALLCHKEPAQGTQSPLLGAFLPFAGYLGHKDKRLHAQKESIILSWFFMA